MNDARVDTYGGRPRVGKRDASCSQDPTAIARDKTDYTLRTPLAGPSFQPGVPVQKTNLAARIALNKVRLGSILPNKPQIQFKPPRRNVPRPVKESDITPENMAKLSIDELIDISGIHLGESFGSSVNRVTNTTSRYGTKKTGEMDSVIKSFQVPIEDETMTNKNSEITRNDGLQVKATGGCSGTKCLAVPFKLSKSGAKTISSISDDVLVTGPMNRATQKNGAMVSSTHLQIPPRLPPVGNSSSRGKHSKGEHARTAALTRVSKKARKQKVELDGSQVGNKRFISKQDGGKQSGATTREEKNVSKKQLGIFSYNNNGNTCPGGVKGQVYECRREHCSSDENPRKQDPDGAQLQQLDQLDDRLGKMINKTTGEGPTSQTPGTNPTLTLEGAVERNPPPGFNVPTVDLSRTSSGMDHLAQSPTDFTPTTVMNPFDESTIQLAHTSSISSNTTPVIRHQMTRQTVPPPPGFQSLHIYIEHSTSTKSSAYVDNEKGIVESADDRELCRLGQSQPTSEEWDIDDWCYVVQWPDGWRETNRDASYLPADVREQLHIDLGRLEGVTPRQPQTVKSQPSNRADHTGAGPSYQETSKSNGNNNHKHRKSNGSNGQFGTVGEFSEAPQSPKSQSKGTLDSSSIIQKESTNLTSAEQTITNQHEVSSRYASDVMISSDSNWSQSTVDWKVDIEELLILLSGRSDDTQTSEFQSFHTNFPSICTEKATLCDMNTSSRSHHEFKLDVKRRYHSDRVVCLTLQNGELDIVELMSSTSNEVEILFDTLTDVEEDSLERYLSDGTWTDREMDFLLGQDFARNQHFNPTIIKNNCEVTSVLREAKAVRGRGVTGSIGSFDLHGREEYGARHEPGHWNSATKSVQVHHDYNNESRNGVGRRMQRMRRKHSLASESYASTNRPKVSKELSKSSLPIPLNDGSKTDSDSWQVSEAREASAPPAVTESQVSVRIHQHRHGTPEQIYKELKLQTSAESSGEYAHPRDVPACEFLRQEGAVGQQSVDDTLQTTHKEGHATEVGDSTDEDHLNPPSDRETEQRPLPMNWSSAPKPVAVKIEKSNTHDIGNDENCPLRNKPKGTDADDGASSRIQYNKDVPEHVLKEHHVLATCGRRRTQDDSKLAGWKNATEHRRHSRVYGQSLAKDKHDSSSTVHGEDSLKQMAKKVELATTSSSSEPGYVINGAWSQTVSIEEWMRINDEQLDQAIKMERINGGRPAKQVAPSTNTYQRILRWLKESDFSVIPRRKRAKQS
ncbi:uncharacterized protein LOC117302608 [Asterias rubens]|uniref:uncharacterized protein LOC117302608 n=1 Tax=Asterias rubens TaxID=7604 RepID=UPI0014552D64|nr:uncharacterized protein LOC117302608 [Asterias rubens]